MGAAGVSYKNYQYSAYYSDRTLGEGDNKYAELIIARRSIEPVGDWEYSKLNNYRVTSEDTHNRINMAISEGDGVIHVTFDHHNTPKINYARTAQGVADNPENIEWNDNVFTYTPDLGIQNLKESLDVSRVTVTYPTLTAFPGGNLILYMRNGHANGGAMKVSRYDASENKWVSAKLVSSGEKANYNGNVVERGPYTAGGMRVSPNGDLHVAWVFREEPENCNPGKRTGLDCNHGLYYAFSKDEGQTWYASNGALSADITQNQFLSVEDQNLEVLPIPTALRPSNVSIASAIDLETGMMHVLISHKTSANGPSKIHHYYRSQDGSWKGGVSSFDASDVQIAFRGDQLFAFAGRGDAQIYYASRDSNFEDWTKMTMPEVSGSRSNIGGGYTTWDISLLNQGIATAHWHRQPQRRGDASPIDSYIFNLK